MEKAIETTKHAKHTINQAVAKAFGCHFQNAESQLFAPLIVAIIIDKTASKYVQKSLTIARV